MSFAVVGLGKLLNAMYATRAQRIKMLRADLRSERDRAAGRGGSGGGDFYGPFWADAKAHVAGDLDLRDATAQRIASNERSRTRLYPELQSGFLRWWEQARRQRNEPFRVIPTNVRARFEIAGVGTVKVENTLSITVGDDGHRIIYPYFCEDPSLSEEPARLGLWLMSQCINDYALADMRVLDVIAGRSFSTMDTPLIGNEGELFAARYQALMAERLELSSLY